MEERVEPWNPNKVPLGSKQAESKHSEGNAAAEADSDVALLHKMADRIAAAAPLPDVLRDVVEFVTAVVKCNSCFIYVLEKDELVLRASKNPHPEAVNRLKLKVGHGITGWVAEHHQPV